MCGKRLDLKKIVITCITDKLNQVESVTIIFSVVNLMDPAQPERHDTRCDFVL